MKTLPFSALAASLLLLAGCNNNRQPEVVDMNPDPMAGQLANAAPIELPPAIKAEKTFRCKDNSLAYVTFFDGDKQVFVRTAQGGTPTTLRAANAGEPLTAEGGWELTGDVDNITLAQPGKSKLTCRSS